MTFNALIPLNSDSPSIFPSQNQTNMTRLQTLFGADHQFNLTSAADDGYHNIIHMTQQAPSGPLAATGRGYVKSSAARIHDFYMDDTGVGYQITPTMPIRASVNFSGLGSTTIRSQFNVSSVTYGGVGVYVINFTSPMPDNNYMVQITGMLTTGIAIGCIAANGTYGTSVTTTSVAINFANLVPALSDVIMGNVTIFSVT